MKKLLTLLLLLPLASIARGQAATQCLPAGQPNVFVLCSSAPQPNFVQAAVSSKSSGSVASINAAYGSNTTKGNTLIVVFSNGNNNNAAAPITDTLTLTWFKAVQVANSTAFETEIWYAPNTAGGADTVTVTPGGSNASIAMTIYEVPGLVYPAINSSPTGSQALDQTTSATGTGATSPVVNLTPIVPNEYVFAGFGLGTAAQTITVVAPYNNDSGQQNPTTPAGLFSFVSASLFKPDMVTTSPSATATSEPWAVAVASFKTLTVPVQGTVQVTGLSATALPVASAVPGLVNEMNDKFGRQIIIPFAMRDLIKTASVQTTNATQTTLLASQASQFADLVSLTITNETATACTVSLTDGTTTYKFNVANQQGAGFTWNPATPIPAASTATAWQVTGCASATLDYVASFVLNK